MRCGLNPKYECPLALPYCPIAGPGLKYCSYTNATDESFKSDESSGGDGQRSI